MTNKRKVLNITPHLGGGVGSIVMNWMKADTENIHISVTLDYASEKPAEFCKENNIQIHSNMAKRPEELKKLISDADIVVLNWWNHPLLYDFMANFEFPPCRLAMWNHTSGLYPPYLVNLKAINLADFFVFSTSVCYEIDKIKNLEPKKYNKLRFIWSAIDTSLFKNIEKTEHKGFNVGYVGTADYGKLNRNFLKLCDAVKIKDTKFSMFTGDSQQHLIEEAKNLNISNKFDFRGSVKNIVPELLKMDVFGYPLQEKHFGACEQALGEAMMAGCVPVVLNHRTERQIVNHMKTGIIANSDKEYIEAIEYLYKNPDIRSELSKNARISALEQYSTKNSINKWNKVFEEMEQIEKHPRLWESSKTNIKPYELYIESLCEFGKPFNDFVNAKNQVELNYAKEKIIELFNSNEIFKSENKGSVLQYLQFFPEDEYLKLWKTFLN